MRTPVNMKLLFSAVAVVFVVYSIWLYLQTRLVLWPTFDPSAPSRPTPENVWLLRVWAYLGRAVFCFAFVWIFTRGFEGKRGVGEGIRYGLSVGILMLLPAFFAGLAAEGATQPGLLATRFVLDFIGFVLLGILTNMVYRPRVAA